MYTYYDSDDDICSDIIVIDKRMVLILNWRGLWEVEDPGRREQAAAAEPCAHPLWGHPILPRLSWGGPQVRPWAEPQANASAAAPVAAGAKATKLSFLPRDSGRRCLEISGGHWAHRPAGREDAWGQCHWRHEAIRSADWKATRVSTVRSGYLSSNDLACVHAVRGTQLYQSFAQPIFESEPQRALRPRWPRPLASEWFLPGAVSGGSLQWFYAAVHPILRGARNKSEPSSQTLHVCSQRKEETSLNSRIETWFEHQDGGKLRPRSSFAMLSKRWSFEVPYHWRRHQASWMTGSLCLHFLAALETLSYSKGSPRLHHGVLGCNSEGWAITGASWPIVMTSARWFSSWVHPRGVCKGHLLCRLKT